MFANDEIRRDNNNEIHDEKIPYSGLQTILPNPLVGGLGSVHCWQMMD